MIITVTGATGTIGRILAEKLADQGHTVRALVRDPDRARGQLPTGVQLVQGDFAHAAPAFAGATAAFLLAPPGPALPEQDRALLAALPDSVTQLVKLSAFGVDAAPELASSRWHGPGERAVAAMGRRYTILRPAGFASNTSRWGTEVPDATGDGRHAVIDPRDVAEVAATALVGATPADSIHTLTGPEALTTADQAAILARVLGRPFRLVPADLTAYPPEIRAGLDYVRAQRAATVTDEVACLLGRPPRSFETWARECAR